MDLSEKKDYLEKILSMMKSNGLTHIFLENYIHCIACPGNRYNGYQIVELRLLDNDRIEVWQGPGYKDQTLVFYLDEFDLYDVTRVEKELSNTISKLKQYRVQVISYVDVKAPNPERAMNLVSCRRSDIKQHLLWVDLGNKIEEIK